MLRRFLAPLTVLCVLALGLAAAAFGLTSHAGWPTINGIHYQVRDAAGHTKDGTAMNDELLGHGGSDTLNGEAGDDVIWGDWDPSGNDATQHDVLSGGPGNDWIYSSHGFNTISGGPGDDHIKFHFGTGGSVDCGPGKDVLAISHKLQKKVKISNCEIVTNSSLGF
jgi:Ca2+-binding RTX toxin-like protein